MELNRSVVFALTSLCFFILVLYVKKHGRPAESVLIYTLGDECKSNIAIFSIFGSLSKLFLAYGEENKETGAGLLHIAHAVKKADTSGKPTVVRFLKESLSKLLYAYMQHSF